jgi:outer membrane protein assembly factor BamB
MPEHPMPAPLRRMGDTEVRPALVPLAFLALLAGCPVPPVAVWTCGTQSCDLNASCLTTHAGVSTCLCNEGYSGDGTSCAPVVPQRDAGAADAGAQQTADAGEDAGMPGQMDAGPVDAGADAGPADSGSADAGRSDAGTLPPEGDAGAVAVTYQINPAHSGGVSDPSIDLPMQEIWSTIVPGAVSYPVIAQGLVFITAAGPGSGGTLTAFDAHSGAIVWGPLTTGGPGWSHLAWDVGRIFLLNSDGVFASYDALTGEKQWLQIVNSQSRNFIFASQLPVAWNGLVIVADIAAAGTPGDVYAASELDGSPVWTGGITMGNQDNTSCPTVGDGLVFTSYICNLAFAGNQQTGQVLWAHDAYCDGGGQGLIPVLYGGNLYYRGGAFGAGNFVLNASTGVTLGAFAADPEPAFQNGRGYALTGGTLEGFDVATNTINWMFTGDGMLSSAPIAVNGFVLIGSQKGTLFAVDGMSGTQVWSADVGGPMLYTNEFDSGLVRGLAAGQGVVVATAPVNPDSVTDGTIVKVFAAASASDAGPDDASEDAGGLQDAGGGDGGSSSDSGMP